MKPLTPSQLSHILNLLDSGASAHEISTSTSIHHSTISRIRSKHRPNLATSSGGRPRLLTSSDTRYAVRLITSQKADNASQVKRLLANSLPHSISTKTKRRTLSRAGMKAVVKVKRPLLKPKLRKDRLDWALAYGRKWVWKKDGEGLSDRLVSGTLNFGGGSLIMWGCMFWEGCGYACQIEGKMDADLYVSILEDNLEDSMEYYGKKREDFIFQQDNDSKHKSKKAQNWFKENNIDLLLWPAQSPDFNLIEHLWDDLKIKLEEYEEAPRGIGELWTRVDKEWNDIKPEVCQNLIESMPRRVEAVIKAKGGYTKY
ncbi:hypothetical protein Agabi119p4_9303 [Agaricus bisporus var. burnettii]|uniref:Tc1-like transposase DDE domain-containing protein n=1 Tax=Agaricus bisporus var. burnettii TaxID=192524 RepID=A0A8H7C714_AGABI|nr:hypothetical protein Agabi119p4_9295 [Agaricus bisporus var. burnettii]KAF7762709.1 hypothetical protein Agabi119p4_9302 [Agaricus bisporus var. burnettii]KAF7762710.1 hypothetical protein Agabi119p4_9303 [Agaricus bisporus var. burnettii]